MLKVKLSIVVFLVVSLLSLAVFAEGENWKTCWNGDGDDATWVKCNKMCAARGQFCKTVFPRKSYCDGTDCVVDFWMMCMDGYKRIDYEIDTGYSPICEGP